MAKLAIILNPSDGFWTDVFKRPNSFNFSNKEQLNPNPFVDEEKIAYLLVPSSAWNAFQNFLNSKGIRQEAKELFGKRFTISIPYKNIVEIPSL